MGENIVPCVSHHTRGLVAGTVELAYFLARPGCGNGPATGTEGASSGGLAAKETGPKPP